MTVQSISRPHLSLIIPTYNEKDNLTALVERVHRALDGRLYELIIVDDDSPDGTAELAESLSHTYPIKVICRKGERGLATAVLAGFNWAKGAVLGVIDADLQHPPERIPQLLQEIERGASVVVASRYVPGGGIEGWSFIRRLISKGATAAARLVLPSIRKVKDPLSGFFLFRKEVIEDTHLHPIGYKILLEILARGKAESVSEVPYTFRERAEGQSKLNSTEQVNYLKHLFTLASKEKEMRRFLKFCLVGANGSGIHFGMFWVLTRFAGMSGGGLDLVAQFLAFETSVLANFTLNDLWTFRDRRLGAAKATISRLLKFNLICMGAEAIYLGGYTPLTRIFGTYDLVALLIVVAIGVIWNFGMSIFWTWRKSQVQPAQTPFR